MGEKKYKLRENLFSGFLIVAVITAILFLIFGFHYNIEPLQTFGIVLITISVTEIAKYFIKKDEEREKEKKQKEERIIELKRHFDEFIYYYDRKDKIDFPVHNILSNLKNLITTNIIQYKKDFPTELFQQLEKITIDAYSKKMPGRFGKEQREDPFVKVFVKNCENFSKKLEKELEKI